MTKSTVTLVLALGTTGVLCGCDVEPDSALAYDTVARVEIGALRASPWGKEMLATGSIDIEGTDACATFVKSANTVTIGTGNQRLEVYIEGEIDIDTADDCAETLEKEITAKKPDDGEPRVVRAELVSDGLFAFVVGPAPLPSPSKARLEDLVDADPSPDDKPVWFTTRPDSQSKQVQHVEGWMDPAKGLDARIRVEFSDVALAAKSGAEATMFLTMLRMSDEMSDVAKGVTLNTSGDTVTADVHETEMTMKRLVAQNRNRHPSSRKALKKRRKQAKENGGFSISFGAHED